MFKLTINAGHGLPTAGKHCLKSIDPAETKEWSLNSRVCEKIEAKLKQYDGIEWIRLDDVTGKVDVPLQERTDKANAFKADFYLSIHHNAGIHGGNGGGIVAYVYRYADAISKEWQKDLYDECIRLTGLKGNRSTPLHTANFHELRESDMPSVLMECGFMDSTVDTPIILTDKFADQIATACVNVIVKRGKLTKKPQPAPAPVKDIEKGDLVAIKSGAYYYGTRTKVPDWAISQKWFVNKIEGDRAVLGENEKHDNHLDSAISTAYLEPVASAIALKVGSLVSIHKGSKYYGSTKPVPDWVLEQNWYVSKIKNDRIVLGENEKKNNNLNSALNKNDLTVVTASTYVNGKKSIHEIALEVKAGKWGDGLVRRVKLTLAGYDYEEVRAEVNRLYGITK